MSTDAGNPKTKPVEYDLRLRVLPDQYRTDLTGIRRLRAALKCLVRSYRLQPVKVVLAVDGSEVAR